MGGGLILIIGSVWYQLDGGPYRVAEVTRELGRAAVIDSSFDLSREMVDMGDLAAFCLGDFSRSTWRIRLRYNVI